VCRIRINIYNDIIHYTRERFLQHFSEEPNIQDFYLITKYYAADTMRHTVVPFNLTSQQFV
jgi:hypothetical protein